MIEVQDSCSFIIQGELDLWGSGGGGVWAARSWPGALAGTELLMAGGLVNTVKAGLISHFVWKLDFLFHSPFLSEFIR